MQQRTILQDCLPINVTVAVQQPSCRCVCTEQEQNSLFRAQVYKLPCMAKPTGVHITKKLDAISDFQSSFNSRCGLQCMDVRQGESHAKPVQPVERVFIVTNKSKNKMSFLRPTRTACSVASFWPGNEATRSVVIQ